MNELKLCYVDLPWCYFTTQELSQQWGDDWNDAPYEHNAGDPYKWREGDLKQKFEIEKIAVETYLEPPCEHYINSPYSVEMINRGDVPWLESPRYCINRVKIMAGVSIDEFIELIKSIGGVVYTEVKTQAL